jgi:hypothetical protein
MIQKFQPIVHYKACSAPTLQRRRDDGLEWLET